jgi:LDH2 family malate/lactate/ureidoglycolate dehydrogenase
VKKDVYFRREDLVDYIVRFLTRLDVPTEDAHVVADVLVTADARGIPSHGIVRLHTHYGKGLRVGTIAPKADVKVVSETSATLLLDGGNGLGHVIAHNAMERCIEKARHAHLAAVCVRNSNHFGIAGYYAMMALRRDLIGVCMTNARPTVAPTHSRVAALGTNPIAVAIPAGKERPIVLDMATSVVPIGKITLLDLLGKRIPAGWGIDSAGEGTNEPGKVLAGGAALPLGGAEVTAGYKGYGLALVVDVLSGLLSGAGSSFGVGDPDGPRPANVGHFFLAIDVGAFRPVAEFKDLVDALIRGLKSCPKAVGEDRIYIHGEKEFEKEEESAWKGIPVSEKTVGILTGGGREMGIDFDIRPIEVRATGEAAY